MLVSSEMTQRGGKSCCWLLLVRLPFALTPSLWLRSGSSPLALQCHVVGGARGSKGDMVAYFYRFFIAREARRGGPRQRRVIGYL